MDAEYLRVHVEPYDFLCVLKVSGELDAVNADQFAEQTIKTLRESQGPLLVDLSALDFIDCAGVRALAKVIDAMPPGRAVEIRDRSLAVRRAFELLGFQAPKPVEVPRQAPLSERAREMSAWSSAVQASSREAAMYASDVMARLSTTYTALAQNTRFQDEHEREQRLLALSERASRLSVRYRRNAARRPSRESITQSG